VITLSTSAHSEQLSLLFHKGELVAMHYGISLFTKDIWYAV